MRFTLRRPFLLILCASLLAAAQGCIDIGGGTWSAPETVTLKLDPANLHSLDVRTSNGAIAFTGTGTGTGGDSGSEADAVVIATKRGLGRDAEAAQQALRNIQVFVEANSGSGQSVDWRWATDPKPGDWQAEVAFTIKAPARLDLALETHNGTIDASGVIGQVQATTHNGAIRVRSKGQKLDAVSYNGQIDAAYEGPRISLVSHNGAIYAGLEHCAAVAGNIESHNGVIIVTIGSRTSADWDCHTANGQIRFDMPAGDASTADRHFKGRTAGGGTPMVLNSHNGEIHVKAAG